MRKGMVAAVMAWAVGCGVGPASPVVGGECEDDRDCENLCSKEKSFGTGMCTMACTNDQACPEGSVCVDKSGGMCAVSCKSDADCEGFGRAYGCFDIRRATDGETKVCRLP